MVVSCCFIDVYCCLLLCWLFLVFLVCSGCFWLCLVVSGGFGGFCWVLVVSCTWLGVCGDFWWFLVVLGWGGVNVGPT